MGNIGIAELLVIGIILLMVLGVPLAVVIWLVFLRKPSAPQVTALGTVPCRACGMAVSLRAPACPQCGEPRTSPPSP